MINAKMTFIRIVVLVVATWIAITTEAKTIKDVLRSLKDSNDAEDDELDPRVIGGRDAEEGEFPWMVSLHYKKRFICSAFLITPRIVMTAAHCVVFGDEPEDPNYYTGFIGTLNRDGPEQKIKFNKIVAPPEYGYDTEYDIALMTLREPVELNDKVQTVCLPSNNSVYENTTGQVIGWGVTEKWGHEPAKILQTATEDITTYEKCEFTYGVLGIPVTRRHICAGGEEDKGVCFGDSGGPLVKMNEQKPLALGVASFVSRRGCAKKYIPAVYTYIPAYLDWITENAGEEEASNICIRDKAETS